MKMMKAFYKCTLLFVIIPAIIALVGFDMVEGKSGGTRTSALSIGKASFLKLGTTGSPSPVKEGVFAKGEQVILVLENIETFKEVSGECWYDIDFSVETSKGERVFSKEGYLGDYGKDKLPNGILDIYNITVNPELLGIKPGEYIFKTTIYDKLGGGKVSVSKEFTIQDIVASRIKPTSPSAEDMEKAENSPQAEAFRAYIKAVQSGDIEALKALVTDDLATALSGPEAKEAMEFLKLMIPSDTEFLNIAVKEKMAVLKISGKQDGEKVNGTVDMVLDDGQWKVQKLSIVNTE